MKPDRFLVISTNPVENSQREPVQNILVIADE